MPLSRRLFLSLAGLTPLAAVVSACNWKRKSNELANDLVRTSTQPLMQLGFYSWSELTQMPERISWLGFSYTRIGGVLSDEIITTCSENDIDVLYVVGALGPRVETPDDQAFIDGFLKNIDSALIEYGPDGAFWKRNANLRYKPVMNIEVGNEPNYGYGFTGTQAEIAALYSRVLIAAYDHIKKAWPNVTVVGIAAGGASATAPAFVSAVLAELLRAGRTDALDVVSIHSYMGASPPDQPITESWGTWVASEQIQAVSQLMKRYEIDRPLWITESGYSISDSEGGRYSNAESATAPSVSLLQQAGYSIRVDMAAVRYGASRVYHFFLQDTDDWNAGWFGSAPAYTARPVAVAMRKLNTLIRGATRFEVVLDGYTRDDGAFAYRFTTPSGWVIIAWSQAPVRVSIPSESSKSFAVMDMLGTPIAVVSGAREHTADLSELPIFMTDQA